MEDYYINNSSLFLSLKNCISLWMEDFGGSIYNHSVSYPQYHILIQNKQTFMVHGQATKLLYTDFPFLEGERKEKEKRLSKICLSVLRNDLLAQLLNMYKAKFKTLELQ